MIKYFKWIIGLLVLLRLVVAFNFWHPDLNNHIDWGIRFWEYGPSKFYAPESNVWSFTWPNQPPGTMYMFASVRKVHELLFSIFWSINVNVPAFPSIVITYLESNLYPFLLHIPAILADFGIAWLIFKITSKKWAAVVWLLNPIVWYNSSFWGQYDSVINFFALLSFYKLINKKLSWSLLFFAVAIYIKASLLIFAPIWLIYAIRQKYAIKDYLKSAVFSALPIILLTLPFSNSNPITWLYKLYTEKIFVQQLHLITANAFNLWAAIAGIHEKPDSLNLLGMAYKTWGQVLFSLAYIPLLISLIKKTTSKNLIWVLALSAMASFTLLTNMHERYLYPLFPYLTILLASMEIDEWFYWLLSGVGFLNLYNFWFTPKFSLIINFLSFSDRLMPRILGFVVFIMFIVIYSKYLRQERLVKNIIN